MTTRSEDRPDWVRRLAAMGPSIGGAEHLVPLEPGELIRVATLSTGLDDFGEPTWEEPFHRLVGALDTEARLHALGRLMSRHDLLRHLRTRLLVIDAHKRDRSMSAEEIKAPIFITGPARSGTSILHELLGQDSSLRAPLAWEMAHPFPPPAGIPDERVTWAESEFDLWADVNPSFAAVHELAATLPEECLWLFAPEFDTGFWATCANVPSFLTWRAGTDSVPAYRFHRLMLQTLQHQSPGPARPWVLKSPMHLMRLPALFAVYPDARIIHTHRDPVRTLPSSVSTLIAGRSVRSDDVDPMATATGSSIGLQFVLNGLAAQRALLPAAQIADLQYVDLLGNPVETIERVYAELGLPFSPELPGKVRAYLAGRPQHKHGEHRYTAADFGLDPEQIRKELLPYTDAFAVPYES